LAVANYESTYMHYPPAYQLGPDGQPWHSWRVLILPFIERESLFKRYRFDEPWDGPNNSQLAGEMPRTLMFHAEYKPGMTTTNYLAVVGRDTMWPGAVGRKGHEIRSGTSNAILIAENVGLGVHWMEPRDLEADAMPLDFNHPMGLSSPYRSASVATADGALHTFGKDYDPETLRAMFNVTTGARPDDPAVKPLDDGRKRELMDR
jgi:hypothetical protein